MKKGKGRELILLILFIVACILVGVSIANRSEGTWGSYSINNQGQEGYSGFYEVLKRLGIRVSRGDSSIEETDYDTCQIVFETRGAEEEEYLKRWTEAGGTLIYIQDGLEGNIGVTQMGEGIWIQVDCAESLSNGSLVEDSEGAYRLYQYLAEYAGAKKVVFNEYYLNSTEKKLNLWDVMPGFLKITILQLFLCLILYFCYAGKRFGKVKSLVEEVERTENEYLYAVARLYRQAKAWDLVLRSYYQELERRLSQFTRKEEDLLEIWEEEKLPDLEMARSVYKYMKEQESVGKKDKKQIKQMLGMIEYLLKLVEQRRETYWKL